MKNKFNFFKNKKCKYYPCHNIKNQNCLFCFCPLYLLNCPGNFNFQNNKKNCSECVFPHKKNNYKKIIKILKMEL